MRARDTCANFRPRALSENGATLVAVGSVQGEHAMAWTSSDGTAWTARELGAPAAGHPVHLEGVVAGKEGFLITGSYETDTGGEALPAGIDPLAPLLWTSRDGETWTPATIPGSGMRVETIAAGTTGFIAGGARRSGAGLVPAVWTSADGQVWSSAIDLPDGQTGVADEYLSVNAIAVATEAMVAVSGRTGHEAIGRAWSSTDGVRWTRAADLGSADPRIYTIGWTPAGFVAAGLSGEDPVDQTLVLLGSTDGASWKRLVTKPAPSGETPRTPVSDGSRVVLVVAGQTLLIGPLSP